jgi:hypothetical protein
MLGSRLLCGAAIGLVSVAAAGSASAAGSFTTFDPKGSYYTSVAGIDAAGTVAGYYEDSRGTEHGFLRTSDGTITAFDPEGSTFTEATSINAGGEIAGWYRDKSGAFNSFLRGTDGTITTFNPTKGYEPGTIGLNAKGKVAGWYSMDGQEIAGFVGAPHGKIRQLTVQGIAINANGAVTGVDGPEGFVRSPSGKVVSFAGPGDPDVTVPTGINDSGMVAGYDETGCGTSHGFARDSRGDVVAVDPEDSSYTQVLAINDKGALAGYYYYGGYHAFVRGGDGSYTTFDVSGDANGTFPEGINTKGEVAGEYRDSNDVQHGFVGTP